MIDTARIYRLAWIVATRREGGEYDVRIGGACVMTLQGQVVAVP